MAIKSLRRNILQRLFGIPATGLPQDRDCWSVVDGRIEIDPARALELSRPGGALRLEGNGLEHRVLVVRGDDGGYYAFRNHCTHMKRRLDPVPESGTVQCCSVSKSTFDYKGKLLHGPAAGGVTTYPVEEAGGRLSVKLEALEPSGG